MRAVFLTEEGTVSLEKRIHVFSLLLTYLEQSTEVDEVTFANYFCHSNNMGPENGLAFLIGDEVNDDILVSRAEIALKFLSLIEKKDGKLMVCTIRVTLNTLNFIVRNGLINFFGAQKHHHP